MNSRANRFEELVAWQKARVLAKEIYLASSSGEFSRDFGLRDQMRRAAVSIMSNIAEGFERGNPGDFHRFLSIGKGSSREIRSQLYVALDVGYLDQSKFESLMTMAEESSRIVSGLRTAVESKRRP